MQHRVAMGCLSPGTSKKPIKGKSFFRCKGMHFWLPRLSNLVMYDSFDRSRGCQLNPGTRYAEGVQRVDVPGNSRSYNAVFFFFLIFHL